MNNMHPRVLRVSGKLYNCLLLGERAQDAGGPYRESWSMYAQELQVRGRLSLRAQYHTSGLDSMPQDVSLKRVLGGCSAMPAGS